jgi:anti-anti-sigma factor
LGKQSLEVWLEQEKGNPVVHVRGEVDYATVPAFRESLKEAISDFSKQLVLDFREVTFLDSEGLKLLLQVYRGIRDNGGSLKVRGCSHFVARTFEILGMDSRFGILQDESLN